MPSRTAGALASLVTAVSLAGGAATAAASPQLGISADVGVPDGGTASLSIAPLPLLRLHAGVSHNLVSPGVRAGVTLVPLSTWITPTLSLDVGHYWEGDANPMARRLSGDDSIDSAALERFHYDYANAHVGLELGRSWGTFFLHAGVSRIVSTPHDLDEDLMSDPGDAAGSDTTVTFTEDPRITAWAPSARLGFIVFLPL